MTLRERIGMLVALLLLVYVGISGVAVLAGPFAPDRATLWATLLVAPLPCILFCVWLLLGQNPGSSAQAPADRIAPRRPDPAPAPTRATPGMSVSRLRSTSVLAASLAAPRDRSCAHMIRGSL